MLTSIYYSLAIAAYSIFLIQFLIAMFGGSDMDIDVDFDGDGTMDLTWGDIFSFKGLIHFLMGFAGWLSLTAAKGSPIVWYLRGVPHAGTYKKEIVQVSTIEELERVAIVIPEAANREISCSVVIKRMLESL